MHYRVDRTIDYDFDGWLATSSAHVLPEARPLDFTVLVILATTLVKLRNLTGQARSKANTTVPVSQRKFKNKFSYNVRPTK